MKVWVVSVDDDWYYNVRNTDSIWTNEEKAVERAKEIAKNKNLKLGNEVYYFEVETDKIGGDCNEDLDSGKE